MRVYTATSAATLGALSIIACSPHPLPQTTASPSPSPSLVGGCEIAWIWDIPHATLDPPEPYDNPLIVQVRADLSILQMAVHRFCLDHDDLPHTLDQLAEHGRRLGRTSLCTILDVQADPWGTPYRYERDSRTFRLSSAGADRLFDTGDDHALPQEGEHGGAAVSTSDTCYHREAMLWAVGQHRVSARVNRAQRTA